MYGQVHYNRALYKRNPEPGHRYKQIAVIELAQFALFIYEGDVIQSIEAFASESTDALVMFHPNQHEAVTDAEEEFQQSLQDGWVLYDAITQ
jgi:hypothetical protein